MYRINPFQTVFFYVNTILKDPGAVTRVDKLLVLKVYCKIETSSKSYIPFPKKLPDY